jgi:ketosteroid isomerase-like protein
MSKESVELVRRVYEAFAERDLDTLDRIGAEWLTPDFVFESVLTGRVWTGPQWLKDLGCDIWEAFEYEPTVEDVIDAGEQVVVLMHASARGARSGVPVAQRMAIVYGFEDGRIARGKSFVSRAEALEEAGLT